MHDGPDEKIIYVFIYYGALDKKEHIPYIFYLFFSRDMHKLQRVSSTMGESTHTSTMESRYNIYSTVCEWVVKFI